MDLDPGRHRARAACRRRRHGRRAARRAGGPRGRLLVEFFDMTGSTVAWSRCRRAASAAHTSRFQRPVPSCRRSARHIAALGRMEHKRSETLKDARPISTDEIEIITWMILHASVAGSLEHLKDSLTALRVVGRCSCGCPSVDFAPDGQTLPAQPIANATGEMADGTEVGVILWGQADAITGLEFYEMGGAVEALPLATTLRTW